MHKQILRLVILTATVTLLVWGCGIDQNPVISEPVSSEISVTLAIVPPASLRTTDTWSFWNLPVEITFSATIDGTSGGAAGDDHDGHGVSVLNDRIIASAPLLAADESLLLGSIDLPGMSIRMSLEDGKNLFEVEHDGEVHEHHAEAGQHHVEVNLFETATGHSGHGGATVSHCEVHLVAISSVNDTLEFELLPVQGGHGFRYEVNAELPLETYDIHIEVEPPHFLRTHGAEDKWTTDIEAEFTTFVFDGSYSGGLVGETMWVGAAGDSLEISLSGGSVRTYGAVGLGALPLSGNETVNFSLHLSDPTVESHNEPLFESIVTATIVNHTAGTTTSQVLKAMYGEHGFHFGENMHLGLGSVMGGGGHDDGGH